MCADDLAVCTSSEVVPNRVRSLKVIKDDTITTANCQDCILNLESTDHVCSAHHQKRACKGIVKVIGKKPYRNVHRILQNEVSGFRTK